MATATRARTHKFGARFAPKAAEILSCREMLRCARSRHHYQAADLLEHFHGCERFSRPRPETVQCELCLLSGLDINKEVVVLLPRRLALPIEIRRIARRHLDGRTARENRGLLCASAAQHQVLHALRLE